MFEEDMSSRPLSVRDFILGDAGFALTAFLVCVTRFSREVWRGGGGLG